LWRGGGVTRRSKEDRQASVDAQEVKIMVDRGEPSSDGKRKVWVEGRKKAEYGVFAGPKKTEER